MLRKTFEEVDGYDEMIVLRGVTFESHCEHHVAPIIGRVMGRLSFRIAGSSGSPNSRGSSKPSRSACRSRND